MKTCLNCGAQIDDNSLFCTECGKQIPQGNVCSHCGATTNNDDGFCQNCGKPLNQPVVIEEETKSDFKKYLPYVIGMILILGLIGFYSSKSLSVSNDNSTDEDSTVLASDSNESVFTSDSVLISEWYGIVFKNNMTDATLDKYLSPEIKKRIWTDDYEGCYEYWRFRTTAQDYNPEIGDVSKIKSIISKDDGWYEINYLDMGNNGKTKVKVKNNKIVDFVQDSSWDSSSDVDEGNTAANLDWLQGHWVYEQGSYKGHFIIQGNKITQYSSMNPERYEATFRIEDGEIRARLAGGMDLAVPIDYVNQRIDYGDGCWMHKVSSSSDNGSNPYIGKTYKGGGYVGGLYTEMTITFLDSNNCRCVSDWYQAYPEGKSLNGTYKIQNGHIIVHCAYDGDDYDFDFGVKENGRFIGFDHSDHSLGRMGSNTMTLELLN